MAKPWYHDDEFWKLAGSRLFTDERLALANEEVEGILALLDVPRGSTVLDLCCGVGRHALELARRGFQVTAVDRSADYLAEAKRAAAAEDLSIEFVCADMREFNRSEGFAAVINWFTSLGFFQSRDDERRVVRNIFSSLRDDGRFVIDTFGREVFERNPFRRWWEEVGDAVWLEEREPVDDESIQRSRWIWRRGSERKEFELSLRAYSLESLTELLESCGFRRIQAFGHVSGTPYDETASRLIVLARK